MPAQLIDGKALAATVRQQVARDVRALKADGVTPGLATVLIGEDPASQVYVRMKRKACEEAGINDLHRSLPAHASQKQILDMVNELNGDDEVHGILTQLPLPRHIDATQVLDAIDPAKDVDGFHPINLGRLLSGRPRLVPATPRGVVKLLDHAGTKLDGARVVIVGRSNIVGRPLAALLLQKGIDATVTVAHSRTRDLGSVTREADVLVAAVGVARIIKADMVRPGATVIDVGINRVDDPAHPKGSRLVGDVDFEAVNGVAGAITPVPGGVGPMTVACLLENVVQAARSM